MSFPNLVNHVKNLLTPSVLPMHVQPKFIFFLFYIKKVTVSYLFCFVCLG